MQLSKVQDAGARVQEKQHDAYLTLFPLHPGTLYPELCALKPMLTLGIETSCDETAAAVLQDDKVLSNIVSSQIDIHKKYGGVVPELASREHLKNLMPIIREALAAASVTLKDINLVAVTYTPGLIGALLVGVSAAKAIAYARGIPFIGVHHGEGHILAAHIEYPGIGYPYIALLVSGGHTALYHVKGLGEYRLLGQTRDDAAGEAYRQGGKAARPRISRRSGARPTCAGGQSRGSKISARPSGRVRLQLQRAQDRGQEPHRAL